VARGLRLGDYAATQDNNTQDIDYER
jgi:hypothetical protein